MLLSFVYIIYFIQIFDHFSFRSVIFSSTSGTKNLEFNVNKPPIFIAVFRLYRGQHLYVVLSAILQTLCLLQILHGSS